MGLADLYGRNFLRCYGRTSPNYPIMKYENLLPEIQERTLKSILWSKFLDKVEKYGGKYLFATVSKMVVFLILAAWIVSPDTFTPLYISALKYGNFALIKLILAGIVVVRISQILYTLQKIYKLLAKNFTNFQQKPKTAPVDSINGIPTNQLISHLLDIQTFKRADIVEKFKIPRREYEKVATSLENLGLIFKDKSNNNARTFKDEFSRQDLENIFDGKTCSIDLNNFAAKVANTIHLSPTPGFSTKKMTGNA